MPQPIAMTAWCPSHGQYVVQNLGAISCPTCQMQQYAQQINQQQQWHATLIPADAQREYVQMIRPKLSEPPVATVDVSRHHRSCALRNGGTDCSC